MKKLYILLAILILSKVVFSQTIPNAGFENWDSYSNYENPVSWDSPNETASTLFLEPVKKETSIVQEGSFSAYLETVSFGFIIPGLLTLGDFNVNIITQEATISGGIPFTSRPNHFKGYIQYEPASADICFIGILLLKDMGSGIYDTIGDGNFQTDQTLLSWTPFDITINYNSPDAPTHMNIIILPSDFDNPQPGSILYIDNLSLETSSSLDEPISNYNIYASIDPSNSKLYVQSPDMLIQSIEVYDIQGRLMIKELAVNSLIWSSDNALDNGLFIVNVITESGNKKIKLIH